MSAEIESQRSCEGVTSTRFVPVTLFDRSPARATEGQLDLTQMVVVGQVTHRWVEGVPRQPCGADNKRLLRPGACRFAAIWSRRLSRLRTAAFCVRSARAVRQLNIDSNEVKCRNGTRPDPRLYSRRNAFTAAATAAG